MIGFWKLLVVFFDMVFWYENGLRFNLVLMSELKKVCVLVFFILGFFMLFNVFKLYDLGIGVMVGV